MPFRKDRYTLIQAKKDSAKESRIEACFEYAECSLSSLKRK